MAQTLFCGGAVEEYASEMEIPSMTYEEYLAKVSATYQEYRKKGIRWGQHLFNVLAAERKDLADRIWAGDLDPFYDDRRVPAFLFWVTEHWDEQTAG